MQIARWLEKRPYRLLSNVVAVALLATTLMSTPVSLAQDWQGPQGGPGSGQGEGGGGGQGGGGHGGEDGADHEDAEHEDGEHSGGKGGQGGGGHAPIGGDGQGSGQGGFGQGGNPVWSHEGIPEVEMGRLNVIRSPRRVLDRAFAEVIAGFDNATMEELYEMSAAQFAAVAASRWEAITIIENLSLLRELWTTGRTSLPDVDPRNLTELSAILIGSASDKTMPITNDTVRALATIIGVQMSDATIASIAAKAETVRLGILAGHG